MKNIKEVLKKYPNFEDLCIDFFGGGEKYLISKAKDMGMIIKNDLVPLEYKNPNLIDAFEKEIQNKVIT